MKHNLLLALTLALSLTACTGGSEAKFWNVKDSQFYKGDEGPVYYSARICGTAHYSHPTLMPLILKGLRRSSTP